MPDAPRTESRGRRTRVAEGIYKDRWGLAATVKVHGVQREIRFPPDTSLKTIRARRDQLRASLRTMPHGKRHTLAHDAGRYLDQVRTELVSIADRQRHLEAWLPKFGHLRTLNLSHDLSGLNAQLRAWRQTLSASSCNQRRDALTNLVKVLYGRRASSDFIDLVRFARPDPVPRWIPRAMIESVLAQLAPRTKTEARLRLLHWTGMRPSQMGRLHREDFRLQEPIPYFAVPRGKGGRLAAVPLVAEGATAARDFIACEAWGAWSCPSANKLIRAAAKRAGVEPFTVYAIRHAFAAGLRHTGSDVADIQDLYGHTDSATTKIYAPPQLAKHAAAIERLRQTTATQPPTSPKPRRFRLVETAGSQEQLLT